MRLRYSVSNPAPLLVATALLVAAPTGLLAQADALFRDFAPDEKFVLTVDGEPDDTAEIYRSQRAASFLVLSRTLTTPFLVIPRSQQVQSVDLMKISQKGNGSIDLLADAVLSKLSDFRVSGTDIAFEVDGRSVVLKERPNLLGDQTLADLQAYSESYVRLQDAYQPAPDAIEALMAASNIEVKVFFGSWCPFCSQYVPRIMKVAQELGGKGPKIRFYGLERGFGEDPTAKAAKVTGVPTGLVMRDGREIGRLRNDAWRSPEKSIVALLDQ